MMVTAWIENCRFGFRAEEVIRKLARAEDAFRRTFGLDGVCWEVGTRQSLLFDFANNSTDCWSKTELFKGLKLFDKKIVIIVQNRCRELVLVVRCSIRLSCYIYRVFFNYFTRFSEQKWLFDFFKKFCILKTSSLAEQDCFHFGLENGEVQYKNQPCIIYGQPFWLEPSKVVGFYESCSVIPIYAPNFWSMTWNWVSTFLSPRSISSKFLTNLVGTLLNFPKLWVF